MPERITLLDLYPDELAQDIKKRGYPPFRAKQLFGWLHKGARFDEMTNLPNALLRDLKESAIDQSAEIVETQVSYVDGTEKYLFSLPDNNRVEGVLMRYKHGATVCISTQVGCRMGCAFCASTLEGCVRNLTAGEMLSQVLAVNRLLGDGRISNIVLMGSGEPLDNYDEVVRFLRLLSLPEGMGISPRHISVSTCGLVPEMRRLAEEKLPITLSVSLHAPSDEVRLQIMPIAKRYPIEDVMAACRYWVETTGRRVIFEYALIDGINADLLHARALAKLLRGLQCHVNLIPLNDVPERNLRGVSRLKAERFQKALEELHISTTIRREMGDDIQGACGQLRRSYLNSPDGEQEERLEDSR